MNMEVNEPPKIDNGAGGSRATKAGKPERIGESGDEPINLIFGEIQLLLAEKTNCAGCPAHRYRRLRFASVRLISLSN